jgi:hypothetical protein
MLRAGRKYIERQLVLGQLQGYFFATLTKQKAVCYLIRYSDISEDKKSPENHVFSGRLVGTFGSAMV